MKWVAKRVVDNIRFHSNLNHVEAYEHLKEYYGVHIDERKTFRDIKEYYQNVPTPSHVSDF